MCVIISMGKSLAKVHDFKCSIRMLQQIFSEILKALNISIRKRKYIVICNQQSFLKKIKTDIKLSD